jgi:hypothetical protein
MSQYISLFVAALVPNTLQSDNNLAGYAVGKPEIPREMCVGHHLKCPLFCPTLTKIRIGW